LSAPSILADVALIHTLMTRFTTFTYPFPQQMWVIVSPLRTAREVFPQAAHPVNFVQRVMRLVG
jgi:hypothetical protein